MGALEKLPTRAALVLGDGTWPRGCLSLTPTAFVFLKCLTSSRRSLALRGLWASPLPCWSGELGGGPPLLPHQTRSSLPLTAEIPASWEQQIPRALSLGESPRASVRGGWARQRAVGETRGLSEGDPMGTGGRADAWPRCPEASLCIPSQLGNLAPSHSLLSPTPVRGTNPLCYRKPSALPSPMTAGAPHPLSEAPSSTWSLRSPPPPHLPSLPGAGVRKQQQWIQGAGALVPGVTAPPQPHPSLSSSKGTGLGLGPSNESRRN